VNWQHLKTVVWLRWKLTANQWKRGGTLNAAIGLIVLVLALVTCISSFFFALVVGVFAFPEIEPDELLLVFDVLVVAYLFFWMVGLITELQRSETLSLENLLHLPFH
jgi:ABC-2 type transport system permease protein